MVLTTYISETFLPSSHSLDPDQAKQIVGPDPVADYPPPPPPPPDDIELLILTNHQRKKYRLMPRCGIFTFKLDL